MCKSQHRVPDQRTHFNNYLGIDPINIHLVLSLVLFWKGGK